MKRMLKKILLIVAVAVVCALIPYGRALAAAVPDDGDFTYDVYLINNDI